MKYFSALLATIAGSDEEREAALEYLKKEDPEIWGDSE